MKKLQSLRGLVDLLPEQTSLWQFIESIARTHFRRAGVNEIRTPLLEPTELFARGIGENTDVVNKEMYSFTDRGDRSCTLRPEGTASVVRAALQHNLLNQGSQRFWYSGPMFRYERPQAGRQRQFHQIGLEFHGYSDPLSDVEAISIAWDLLIDLGIERLSLELNTLGNATDRILYRKKLSTWLLDHVNQLDEDSRQRVHTNPLRVLDSKVPSTKTLLVEAPILTDELSEESYERFSLVREGLANLGIPFIINPRLVRGLDYYNHTAFEIVSDQLGSQSTVCGGGRYDGLIEQLGGSDTPAIGWALGVERLVLLLNQKSIDLKPSSLDFYIVNQGRIAQSVALTLAQQLRQLGIKVELDNSGAAFSKQFKRAHKSNCLKAIIIGDNEVNQKQLRLKDLQTDLPEECYSIAAFLSQVTKSLDS
ncbi:histidyl-tRNA synthetase (chromatophore) [Paulinella micropora]|uniref:histidine--tRNA ligase n=1 Tax=Paulinella micropora TaxID=1928728 RepID=A0A1L5YC31_9EUKA|nr:histidyl-tRNA synthetase [Paulinella micropora]AQX45028.1 histidyl-tRNA synthetase [Paulinella micropora]BBL86242.1 histidyl-tRNA synthetase [Paulinella micropora]